MRRPQISSSQKSVKRPRRRRRTPMSRIAASVALRNLRSAHHHAADSVGAELARRHAEALAELLAEVVLRVEAAAAGDLRHAHVASLSSRAAFSSRFSLRKWLRSLPVTRWKRPETYCRV